jgi:alpha-tubulin suppressor-like RCC1 family protein
MLDTISATLLALDSLGARQSGIPVEFTGLTGFGEIVQGPTTTDINGQLVAKWALGPTPGPQKVTAVRGDIGADLDLAADATGQIDPWPFNVAAPGFYHTCAIDADGAGYCWGSNQQSQLGTEDTLAVVKPAPIPGALVWAEIGGGEFHTCGLTSLEGEVFCWGEGLQTGQGAVELTPVPSIVPGGPWSSLAVGANHTCALKANGKAWCWGEDLEGRLGNGVLEPTGDPTRVTGIQIWNRLSGGHFHTCGLAQDGRAYCWGQGTWGQLGNGGITDQGAPVLVAGGVIWTKISAGRYHSCGISNSGDAYCWGEGGFNQLGNGSTVRQTSPVKVAGEHKWTDINAGQWHTCGVDQNKKLYCWGRAGSIGIGEFGAPTPVVVLPAYDWVSVQTQGIHTCAITSIGETYCWGSNTFGQLGIGNTTDFTVPRMVFRGVILP